jgi:uncharacterized protein (DUF58 family)
MAQRPVTLTTRGVIALGLAPVSALSGVLLGAEELVLLSIALCLLVLGGLVQCAYRVRRDRGVWRVGVDLAASDTEVGGLAAVRVTVGATDRGGTAPVWLEAQEWGWFRARAMAGRRPLPNPAQVRRVPPLDSGGTASFSSIAPTKSRGVFTLRSPRLWCADSFGLVARLVASGPQATVTVYPAPTPVDLDEALLRGEPGEMSEPVVAVVRLGHDGLGDFSGIRPYIPGDRLRLLYWPALARRDELMVRDFEDSGAHRVQVVADIRPLISASGGESVLATVAGVGLAALARGSVVELSTTTGERIAIGPGPHAALALLRAVANIEIGATPVPAKGRRRRAAGPRSAHRDLHPTAGTHLVVTTSAGARDMPASFGFAHLVIAP